MTEMVMVKMIEGRGVGRGNVDDGARGEDGDGLRMELRDVCARTTASIIRINKLRADSCYQLWDINIVRS